MSKPAHSLETAHHVRELRLRGVPAHVIARMLACHVTTVRRLAHRAAKESN